MKLQQSFFCGAAFLVMAASVSAELDLEVGYHSDYEFRGFNAGQDLATFDLDYAHEVRDGVFVDFGLWYGSSNGQGDAFVQKTQNDYLADGFEEFNASIGLTKDFGNIQLSGGYTYRHYSINEVADGTLEPLGNFDTSEIYVKAQTQLSYDIELGAEYIYDFEAYDGGYLEVNLSKYVALTSNVGLEMTAGVAWSFNYNIDADALEKGERDITLSDLSHYYVSLGLPTELRDGFVVTPYIKYVGNGGDLLTNLDVSRDDGFTSSTFDDMQDDYFVGGVTFSVAF